MMKLWKFIFCLIYPVMVTGQSTMDKELYSKYFRGKVFIGDKMPNISFDAIVNNKKIKAEIKDYKGKLLILDFWNIHCTSCIKGMPKLDSLQKLFGNKIQFILVTKNSQTEVDGLFRRLKLVQPKVPSIVNDTILNQTFPHDGEPLHVWISPQGYVDHITTPGNLTDVNISKSLKGERLSFNIKVDSDILQNEAPLIATADSVILSNRHFYSALFAGVSKFTRSRMVKVKRDSLSGKAISIKVLNLTASELFQIAFNNSIYNFETNFFSFPKNNRLLIAVKHPELFGHSSRNEIDNSWWANHTFSYEVSIHSSFVGDIFRIMQEDLNRYLDYEAKIEKRKMLCLILVEKDPGCYSRLKSRYTGKGEYFVNPDGTISIKNMPLKESLYKEMVYANTTDKFPIIDEIVIPFNIDIHIRSRLNDIEGLKKELNEVGLDIIEDYREIEVLAIRDKSK